MSMHEHLSAGTEIYVQKHWNHLKNEEEGKTAKEILLLDCVPLD